MAIMSNRASHWRGAHCKPGQCCAGRSGVTVALPLKAPHQVQKRLMPDRNGLRLRASSQGIDVDAHDPCLCTGRRSSGPVACATASRSAAAGSTRPRRSSPAGIPSLGSPAAVHEDDGLPTVPPYRGRCETEHVSGLGRSKNGIERDRSDVVALVDDHVAVVLDGRINLSAAGECLHHGDIDPACGSRFASADHAHRLPVGTQEGLESLLPLAHQLRPVHKDQRLHAASCDDDRGYDGLAERRRSAQDTGVMGKHGGHGGVLIVSQLTSELHIERPRRSLADAQPRRPTGPGEGAVARPQRRCSPARGPPSARAKRSSCRTRLWASCPGSGTGGRTRSASADDCGHGCG